MANVHIELLTDEVGDLVEIDYYCHTCGIEAGIKGWPAPESLDYPVYCKVCQIRLAVSLTQAGMEYMEMRDNI